METLFDRLSEECLKPNVNEKLPHLERDVLTDVDVTGDSQVVQLQQVGDVGEARQKVLDFLEFIPQFY